MHQQYNKKYFKVLILFCAAMLHVGANAAMKIVHKPIASAGSGQRIAVDAKIKQGNDAVTDARVYFKADSDTRWWMVPMRDSDSGWRGVLPAPALGTRSVDYRIYAVGGDSGFSKTEIFSISVTDDPEAPKRLEAKQSTDVRLDIDEFEQIEQLASEGGEPTADKRVEVRNDVPNSPQPNQIPGFQDYIVVGNATPAAAGAGLAAAGTVATSAGVGAGAVIGGIAAAGAVGAAAGGGGGSDGDSSGGGSTSTPAPAPVTPARTLVGVWTTSGTVWNITRDSGTSWGGTSTPGGCGDTININGSRNGNRVSASFSNPQGGGSLTGVISPDFNRMDISFRYTSGVCDGQSGRPVYRRR